MIRRIISAEEQEKKDRRNKQIIVIILGIIMLISSASYAFMSFGNNNEETSSEKENYGGVDFTKTEYGAWKFTIQGYNFETRYNPKETMNASIILAKTIQSYSGRALYFGRDNPEELATAANTEIIQNIEQFLLKYQESCLTANCTGNYPIKNCTENNVIIFREAEKSKISEQNSCVVIEYNKDEEIIAADAFIFKLLGLR